MSRVNDESLNAICAYAERCVDRDDATTFQLIALDCRDTRAAFAAAQTALAAKDARIAELERSFSAAVESGAQDLQWAQRERARADRLEAQLRAARADIEALFETAVKERDKLHAHHEAEEWQWWSGAATNLFAAFQTIRARLTPANAAADTGGKG